MAKVVTPVDNSEFTIDGGRNGHIRVCSKVGSVFAGQTLNLEIKDPSSQDWYSAGASFDGTGAGAAEIAVPFTGTYRFTAADFTGVAVSFLIL